MADGVIVNPFMDVFFANVAVSFPLGTTRLTATCGTEVLTATDLSTGSYTFPVPFAGNWTITGTDGTHSKTETVSVTYYNQTASVALTYITYLYNNGDVCSAVTGGWQSWGDASGFTTNDGGNLRYIVQAGYSEAFVWHGGARTFNQVAITNNTLHATITYAKALDGTNARVWVGLSSDGKRFVTSAERRGAGEITLDVSAFKGGSYYILIDGTAGSEGGQITVKANNIYIV